MGKPISIPPKDAVQTIGESTARGESIVALSKRFGISTFTFQRWLSRHPEIQQAWMDGKQAYATNLADDLMRTAGAPLHENPKLANAEVQRRRLMATTAQWISSKLLPRVYGERATVEHNHTGEVTVSPLAQLRKLEGKEDAPKVIEATVVEGGADVSEDDCF